MNRHPDYSLPPFDGVEEAQMELRQERAPIAMCCCFNGTCRCEVVDGRTVTGARCRAHLQDGLIGERA